MAVGLVPCVDVFDHLLPAVTGFDRMELDVAGVIAMTLLTGVIRVTGICVEASDWARKPRRGLKTRCT